MSRIPLAGVIVVVAMLVSAHLTLSAEAAYDEPGWGIAQLIEYDDAGNADLPRVAVDEIGNAIVVWQQHDGTRYNVWTNRYVAGWGWGIPELIEFENLGHAQQPQVAVDDAGNAIAVWQQYDGVSWNIWSNRYVVGVGWGAAELIETNPGVAFQPKIAVDPDGNAIAVWYQLDTELFNWDIWANRYVVGDGWGIARLLESDDAVHARHPDVAMDRRGDATVVWLQEDGVRNSIWATRYVSGEGWETPEQIDTDDAGSASTHLSPAVAMDGDGNAFVFWHTQGNEIWSNLYAAGSGWGTPQRIETDDPGITFYYPRVAANRFGNAVVVWCQFDGTRTTLWFNRYAAGEGWQTAELIESDDAGSPHHPYPAMDDEGNAVVAWHHYDGIRNNIMANRYVAGEGWETAQLIETRNSGDAYGPVVAMNGAGVAVAVWYQIDGTRYDIWANRYVTPDTTPPSLELSSPSDGSVVEVPVVSVVGVTEPGASLEVNGMLVTVAPDGSFSCAVALTSNSSVITVTATDAAGNSASVTRNVFYLDPSIALEEELMELQDELDSLSAKLADARMQCLVLFAAVLGLLFVALLFLVMLLKKGGRPPMPSARPEPDEGKGQVPATSRAMEGAPERRPEAPSGVRRPEDPTIGRAGTAAPSPPDAPSAGEELASPLKRAHESAPSKKKK